MFESIGMCKEASEAYLKSQNVKAAVDTCIKLNQWDEGIRLAKQYNISQVDTLLAKQANKFLQRALSVAADGVVGPVTLKAADQANARQLANKIIDQRQTFYVNLSESRPKLSVFLKGWTNRNNNLRKYIENLA